MGIDVKSTDATIHSADEDSSQCNHNIIITENLINASRIQIIVEKDNADEVVLHHVFQNRKRINIKIINDNEKVS